MLIKIKHKGNFRKTDKFFKRASGADYLSIFDKYGQEGVHILASVTPVETGETARLWSYKISRTKRGVSITWHNDHIVNGVPIAIILQYGHATRNGGYVEGRDYINPAIQPVFDQMAEDIWKEVTNL